MELKQIIKILKEKFSQIVFISSGFVLIAIVLASYSAPKYEAALELYVNKKPEVSEAGDYNYDGFYAQQVAEKYTDTVVGLFETNQVVRGALSEIEIADVNPVELNAYKRSLRVEKVAPQIIKVVVSRENKKESEDFVKALAKIGQEKVTELNKSQNQDITLELVDEKPHIELKELSVYLAGFVGLLIGIGLSLIWVALKEYLK